MNAADPHRRLAPERFYWALLDASVLPRRLGRPTEGLGFLLEPLVPQPLEELHAVYVPLPGRRYVACAIDRAALETCRSEGVLTLGPSAVPAFLSAEVDPGRINLLTGPHAPAAVTRRTARWRRSAVLLALTAASLAWLGLERRVSAEEERAARLTERRAEVEREVLGPSSGLSPLPLTLQLEAEVRSLRQTRAGDLPPEASPDAALALGALLARWPDGLVLETDSIHVTEESLHVQARFPSSDEAQELASALDDLAGWRLGQPSLQALGEGVRATLQLQREEPKR